MNFIEAVMKEKEHDDLHKLTKVLKNVIIWVDGGDFMDKKIIHT